MAASFFHYIVIIFFSYCDSVFGIFINFQQCQSCEIGNYSMGYYLPRHSWQYSLSSHSASPRDWKIYTTIHDSASNIPYCNFLLTGLTQYYIYRIKLYRCNKYLLLSKQMGTYIFQLFWYVLYTMYASKLGKNVVACHINSHG